jgi:hypothetical protein
LTPARKNIGKACIKFIALGNDQKAKEAKQKAGVQ